MLRPFALHRPTTVDEAADLLRRTDGESALYAGGTELLILLKQRVLRAQSLIDLKRIPALGEILPEGDRIAIGATATHRAVERSPLLAAACPLMARAVEHVANIRVRHVGTVGGNLAFADPHSDLATLFLAFDGAVRLKSSGGAREVPLGEFVTAPYETSRGPDEILTAVSVRPWPEDSAGAYLKFGLYERPTVTVAVVLAREGGRFRGARVIVGAVGPRPERLATAEAALAGEPVAALPRRAEEIAAAATQGLETMRDLHGGHDYKRDLARVCVRRALDAAGSRARGDTADVHHPHTIIV